MNKLILFAILFSSLLACEKSSYNQSSFLTARIVGFDLNCSTCILEFPDDSLDVKKEIGRSPYNYYQSINLNKGNYQIGQLLKVKIRKPDTDELRPCITLYPSFNYQGIFITDLENFDDLILNDTVILSYHECLHDPVNKMYICFDSVLTDSRCPIGVYCFWEGNAEIRFKFVRYNNKPILFNLNTHRGFTTDTIIDEYKFTLLDLNPYPVLNRRTRQKDYKAKILIEKE